MSVPAGAVFVQPVPRGHNAFAYVFDGQGLFGREGASAGAPKLLVFGDGDAVQARGGEQGVRFLLVSGRPLGEPIARYGPFVMNTREEITQALADLRDGTFVRDA